MMIPVAVTVPLFSAGASDSGSRIVRQWRILFFILSAQYFRPPSKTPLPPPGSAETIPPLAITPWPPKSEHPVTHLRSWSSGPLEDNALKCSPCGDLSRRKSIRFPILPQLHSPSSDPAPSDEKPLDLDAEKTLAEDSVRHTYPRHCHIKENGYLQLGRNSPPPPRGATVVSIESIE